MRSEIKVMSKTLEDGKINSREQLLRGLFSFYFKPL